MACTRNDALLFAHYDVRPAALRAPVWRRCVLLWGAVLLSPLGYMRVLS
jgi:hypothetical protein